MNIKTYQQSFTKRFCDSIKEIEDAHDVDVSILESDLDEEDEYSLELIEDEAKLFANDQGYSLPYDVIELASFPVDPLTISWRYVRPNAPHQIAGGFSLREIRRSLSFEDNQYKIVNEDIDEATQDLMRKAHYFDVQPDVAWELATLLVDYKNGEFPELWYLEYQKMYQLDLDLKTYLEMLLLTKGIMHWQFFFVDSSKYSEKISLQKENLARILEYLPIIFPDQDYKPLRERFAYLYP